MKLKDKKIAFGLTSSFYTFKDTINEMERIILEGGEVFPIMSKGAYMTNSKFGNANDFVNKIEYITGKKIVCDIMETESISTDIMVIAPCSRKQYCKNRIIYI